MPWTWTIPFSILTISAMGLALAVMSWSRKDLRSQLEASQEMNREIMRDYTSLTRTLLGVGSDSPSPTLTISSPPEPTSWQEPEAEFGSLPIDEDLLREFQEDQARTLSGKHARTNPLVEQIVPGQVRLNTAG